jgi:hypothetical protein
MQSFANTGSIMQREIVRLEERACELREELTILLAAKLFEHHLHGHLFDEIDELSYKIEQLKQGCNDTVTA